MPTMSAQYLILGAGCFIISVFCWIMWVYFKFFLTAERHPDKFMGSIITFVNGLGFLIMSATAFTMFIERSCSGYGASPAYLEDKTIYQVVDSFKEGDNYEVLVRMPDGDKTLRLFRFDRMLAPGDYKAAIEPINGSYRMNLEPYPPLK